MIVYVAAGKGSLALANSIQQAGFNVENFEILPNLVDEIFNSDKVVDVIFFNDNSVQNAKELKDLLTELQELIMADSSYKHIQIKYMCKSATNLKVLQGMKILPNLKIFYRTDDSVKVAELINFINGKHFSDLTQYGITQELPDEEDDVEEEEEYIPGVYRPDTKDENPDDIYVVGDGEEDDIEDEEDIDNEEEEEVEEDDDDDDFEIEQDDEEEEYEEEEDDYESLGTSDEPESSDEQDNKAKKQKAGLTALTKIFGKKDKKSGETPEITIDANILKGKVIAITGDRGVGKSTVATLLGFTASNLVKTMIIELSETHGVRLFFKEFDYVDRSVVDGLYNSLMQPSSLPTSEFTATSSLSVLLNSDKSRMNELKDLENKTMELIKKCKLSYDLVILDCDDTIFKKVPSLRYIVDEQIVIYNNSIGNLLNYSVAEQEYSAIINKYIKSEKLLSAEEFARELAQQGPQFLDVTVNYLGDIPFHLNIAELMGNSLRLDESTVGIMNSIINELVIKITK